jgi:peroxiredoxin family protein
MDGPMADDDLQTDRSTIAVIVQSGDFERIHYALALAASALAVNRPAVLFFTGGAIRALLRGDNGFPGWAVLPADAATAGAHAVGEHIETGAERDAVLKARGVGDFETLLDACVQLKARIIVCEMGLRAMAIERPALRDDVPVHVAGIVTLYEEARGGQILVL